MNKNLVVDISGAVPTDADLKTNDIGINNADGKIYTEFGELAVTKWQDYAMKESEMNSIREMNSDNFAASGFVHYGKVNSAAATINEGMYSHGSLAPYGINSLYIGREIDSDTTSKTDFAVTHIAGFISDLLIRNGNARTNYELAAIKFPEAPDGTIIYDSTGSARGTGNANLDLLNDTDPKYGNNANGDTNEAVARAFEGELRDGNIKGRGNGDHWDLGVNQWTINDGFLIYISDGSGNTSQGNSVQSGRFTNGDVVELSMTVFDANGALVGLHASGTDASDAQYVGTNGVHTRRATITDANNVKFFVRGAGSTGQFIKVTNCSIRKVSEEVVIDRHDLFGGEYFLEEVNETNPFVYPKGMIQSKASTMNGIACSRSARPVTYYAVFDGDTSSAGLGVDFFSASESNKRSMLQDKSNNLYLLDDGRLVQFRMRQRTFKAPSNGKWDFANSAFSSNANYLYQSPWARPVVQGFLDSVSEYVGNQSEFTFGNLNAGGIHDNAYNHQSLYTARQAPDRTIEGECYFNVWGVSRRLNQGAYHPSFNPLGCKAFTLVTGSTPTSGARTWYSTDRTISSTSMCFDGHDTFDATKPVHATFGDIANPLNDIRPDSRYYDGIYEGGDGGVNDYRLSAWDMSSKEEAAKVFQKVVNGTYRGEERIPFTYAYDVQYGDGSSSQLWYINHDGSISAEDLIYPVVGEDFIIVGNDGVANTVTPTAIANSNSIQIQITIDRPIPRGTNSSFIYTVKSESTVSGEFQMVDVIGSPQNILNTPDLANGWQGGWITNFDEPSAKLTRKAVADGRSKVLRPNQTWDDNTTGLEMTLNVVYNHVAIEGSTLVVVDYTAFAKQTKEANNESVLNSYGGIGDVFATADNGLSTFSESLMGKVMTDTSSKRTEVRSLVNSVLDASNTELVSSNNYNPEHVSLTMTAPDDNSGVYSPAIKALWYQTSNNQQVSMNFAWNELVWQNYNTSDFLDISMGAGVNDTVGQKIHITSGDFKGVYLHELSYSSRTWQELSDEGTFFKKNGDIVGANDATVSHGVCATYGGWGDDSTINITDGTNTYTNLNGDICLRGSSELSKPIGYTRNQARISTQTRGVDI